MSQPTTIRFLDSADEHYAAFTLMRELRPHLQDADTFVQQVARQAHQGYRLLGAFCGEQLAGLAGIRTTENLIYGRFIYVDDLVVEPSLRSHQVGAALLDAVREEVKRLDYAHLVLDTGLHMALAQRFYFRQGLLAKGMHFVQAMSPPQQQDQAHGQEHRHA